MFSKPARITVLITSIWLLCSSANAEIVFTASGTSGKGVPVVFEATFTISGDNLSICLENISTVELENKDELLTSLYFDIFDGSSRPTLGSYSASADIFTGNKNGNASNQLSGQAVDAVNSPGGWQFRGDLTTTSAPGVAFGIGTAGNSNLSPNGFTTGEDPGQVGLGNSMIEYGIYTGDNDSIPNSFYGGGDSTRVLVDDKILFTFTGVTNFNESHISKVAFGTGTGPDLTDGGELLFSPIPEPSSLLTFAILLSSAIGRRGRTLRQSSP